VIESSSAVGTLVADLHTALAGTATVSTAHDAARWRDDALRTLDIACACGESASIDLARRRRGDIETILDGLGALAGTTVIEGHGDLHVGQILRSEQGFVVTDFDGNPVLPPEQRILAIPAVQDVAGMVQSLAHAAIVARKYTDLDDAALAETSAAAQHSFLAAYTAHPATRTLYDPAPLQALRIQQVLREIIYAARHLPRWMYIPDAALPALLNERTAP
jgi:maltokinase